eukprot:SAG11_NODE_8414_length_1018_cov_1.201306_2_plen_66_part_00
MLKPTQPYGQKVLVCEWAMQLRIIIDNLAFYMFFARRRVRREDAEEVQPDIYGKVSDVSPSDQST